MTEFAACHASAQGIVADADGVIFEAVREVVPAFSHRSDKHAYTLLRSQVRYVVPDTYDFGVEAQSNLSAIWWKVIGDRILDDLEQFLLRIRRADGKSMEELNHQAGKPLERAWYADRRADFDQNALGSVDVNL